MMFDFAKLPTKTLQGRQTRRACVRIKSLEKHKVNVKEGRRGQEEVKKRSRRHVNLRTTMGSWKMHPGLTGGAYNF
jgi:hypothetical protein